MTRSTWTWERAGGCPSVHLEGMCSSCELARISRLSLGEVEDLYHSGRIGQNLYEAYCHVWATSEYRYSDLGTGWTRPPEIPEVAQLAERLRTILTRLRD